MPLGLRFTPGQRTATWALARFCTEHGHAPAWIDRLHACLAAIEARDASAMDASLRPFDGGGMGSFIDWGPLYRDDPEKTAYLDTIWNALYGHWREQMKPHWPAQKH